MPIQSDCPASAAHPWNGVSSTLGRRSPHHAESGVCGALFCADAPMPPALVAAVAIPTGPSFDKGTYDRLMQPIGGRLPEIGQGATTRPITGRGLVAAMLLSPL